MITDSWGPYIMGADTILLLLVTALGISHLSRLTRRNPHLIPNLTITVKNKQGDFAHDS